MPYPKGKKQSPEAAQKRKQTMLERYGVSNCAALPGHGESLRGRKIKPRTDEHRKNIVEGKRRAGTLKHTEETKRKIRESVRKTYHGENPPVTVSEGNNVRHQQGKMGKLHYRSSYEKAFIEYCLEHSIAIESAETKEFRVHYEHNGKTKYYYPDFYLSDLDLVVEIKPTGRMIDEQVQHKACAASKEYSYAILTEEELENLNEYFLC